MTASLPAFRRADQNFPETGCVSRTVQNRRRTPSQSRSVATVETILEAVARIVEAESATRFTTNRVAEKAGYSIGTLYSYFPNKQSLLQALVIRETRKQEEQLRRLLAVETPLPADQLIRTILRTALRPFDDRRGLQRAMMELLFSDQDMINAAMQVGDRLMPLLMQHVVPPETDAVDSITAHATLGAVIGAVLALGRNGSAVLQSAEVEDELVRLMLFALRVQ